VRAVLLYGTAECFTAGNDVADFLKRSPGGEGSPTWRLFEVLPALQKPIVAAVGGPAVGIGSTLLLHCDLVYAASNARFQLPFVPLGIVPEFGSTLLLPMLAGYQRAAELLLLGQPFGAQKAYEVGLVTEVVAPEDLLARAETVAGMLAALPPESLRLTKKLMKSTPVRSRIMEEGRLFLERLRSPEAKEAMSAFLEKRKPRF
jgi:enoyl-CoA hydratase/carnithine racemase